MVKETQKKAIKDWAADDRPREKMIAQGKGVLSNAELIAILIGSGSGEQSAVALARDVLSAVGDNLYALSKLNLEELTAHKGIGAAKAISIMAAMELGRRWSVSAPEERHTINNSKEAYDHFLKLIDDPSKEHFMVAYLNQGNKVIKVERISTGGITSTPADPKVIFKNALLKEATAIMLCHNHPSGVTKPSADDRKLTQKLVNAGNIFDIKVIDHLIIGEKSYFSFAENGMMNY
ncbi:MAG: DNA repair protein RadC [Bacteroidales bacterium]|nr:DNA repair protein RadC [Bacteroidales bacterium]